MSMDATTSTASQSAAEEDQHDIELSHQYRLSLKTAPSQSSFRVLALLFYTINEEERSNSNNENNDFVPLPPFIPMSRSTQGKGGTNERTYIVGTNDEPGYIGGAICAERAAMVQLRFAPPHTITKVVIATDSWDPISPGMLCREFLAGHGNQVPWNVLILSSGNKCQRCGQRDESLFQNGISGMRLGECDDGKQHDLRLLRTTLKELYTYPSPYTRLTATESTTLGKQFAGGEIIQRCVDIDESAVKLLRQAQDVALSSIKATIDNHPIHFGCAAMLRDGTIITSHQSSGLEYGCTLDAVSQIAPQLLETSGKEGSNKDNPPVLLVQADQYGVAHAPFAPARAFLTEHGFDDCRVLVHDVPSEYQYTGMVASTTATVAENVASNIGMEWRLVVIKASDLAPNSPAWTNTI